MVAVVVVATLVVTSVAGSAQPDDATRELPVDVVDVPRDSVLIDVAVRPDGSAVVQVEIRTRLDDESTERAFEDERERIEDERLTVAGTFAEGMRDAARLAERDLGREMTVRNATVSTGVLEVPDRMGVVVFRFQWEGFAAVDPGGRMTAGPALSAIPLEAKTALQLRWPDDYERTGVSPSPDDRERGQVAWEGPEEFGAGQPRVVLQPSGLPRPTRGVPNWLILAGGALLVLGAVGAVRRHAGRGGATGPVADREDDGRTEAGSGHPADPDETATVAAPTADEDAAPSPAEELLSDEERVLELVERNGGRMKQQDVVETMEWSETKTSEVVGVLREEEKLEVYRIGRENVLALPGEMDV